MKRVLAKNTLTCLLLSLAWTTQAQDVHYAQFYENAALRNPALTGIYSGDYKVGVNYRSQWASLSVPFQTMMLAAEGRSRISSETNDYLSYGLTINYDKAASIAFNTLQIMPTINYNKNLRDDNHSYLSAGFGGAFIQRSFDPSKVTTNNQYVNGNFDPAITTGENFTNNRLTQLDLNLGLSFNSSMAQGRVNYYLGAAAYHVLRPKESFMDESQSYSRLTGKYTGQFGLSVLVNDKLSVATHFNYLNQHPHQEWIGGGMVTYYRKDAVDARKNIALSAGIYYRLNDAIIPTVKVDYQQMALTVSYDMATSVLKHAGANAVEMSLYLRGLFPKRRDAMDQMACPRFEMGGASPYELFREYN
ncbi:MAG: type IX secretion system membrane protein PorP/SprF [Sphingobacteriales bacterium]|nr:MAG: type IX secretion system membrane protein PorP/SprF [Sphingobacteriales bacterium]